MPIPAPSSSFDPRTDRGQLTSVGYPTGDLLADRQQIYRFALSRARRSLPLPLTVHLRSAAIDSSSGFRWLQNPGRIFTSALRRATERTSAVAALVGATDNARHGPRFRLAR